MSNETIAQKLISYFERSHSKAVCPCCSVKIDLAKSSLFYLDNFSPEANELVDAWREDIIERKVDLKDWRKKISKTSLTTSTSVNIGFTLEKLVPSFASFRFNKNDCRALGEPIDLIIFENLAKRGQVSRIIFADVKSGGARLSQRQKSIQSAIERNKVDWSIYDERN